MSRQSSPAGEAGLAAYRGTRGDAASLRWEHRAMASIRGSWSFHKKSLPKVCQGHLSFYQGVTTDLTDFSAIRGRWGGLPMAQARDPGGRRDGGVGEQDHHHDLPRGPGRSGAGGLSEARRRVILTARTSHPPPQPCPRRVARPCSGGEGGSRSTRTPSTLRPFLAGQSR